MIRILLLALLSLPLSGCLLIPAAVAVGRYAYNNLTDKPAEQTAAAQPAAAPAAATPSTSAAPTPAAPPLTVTLVEFDVPADAMKAKDPELSLLLRKAGEVALKYNVPVTLVSNSTDRDYLMHELMQAGEPAILYRLGEYPRLSISRSVPAGAGESR